MPKAAPGHVVQRRARKPRFKLDLAEVPMQRRPAWYDKAYAYWKSQLGDSPAARQTINVQLSCHRVSTDDQYSRHWRRFDAFCERDGVSSLPASSATVLKCVTSDLALTVNANNMQPYLSAINDAHTATHAGPAPALGVHVVRQQHGLTARQEPLFETPTRLQLPAVTALGMMKKGLSALPDASDETGCVLFRAKCAVFTDYLHFDRGDTGAKLRAEDIALHNGMRVLRKERLKSGIGSAASNVNTIPVACVPELHAALQH